MPDIRGPAPTSNKIRFTITDNDGVPVTGLTNSSDIEICIIRSESSSATVYTGANIETISSIGSWSSPSSGKCRFGEVDTDMPGLYEFHFRDDVFSSATYGDRYIVSCGGTDIGTVVHYYEIIIAPKVDIDSIDESVTAAVNLALSMANNISQPGQEAPPLDPKLFVMIAYLYKMFRNKFTQTATTGSLFADDGTTVDQKTTVSDDGTTFTKGEFVSGP